MSTRAVPQGQLHIHHLTNPVTELKESCQMRYTALRSVTFILTFNPVTELRESCQKHTPFNKVVTDV